MARTPEAALGARRADAELLPSGAAACCAAAGTDATTAAAIKHDATHDAAHDTKDVPLDTSVDLSPNRAADLNDVSGQREEDSGNGDKRETKRKPRRLRDREIGNVVEGQRNMPEILSPCG
jgi:hypothetical protein